MLNVLNCLTINVKCTYTSTRAACCEFLRMISFSLTFLSDCEGRKYKTLTHIRFNLWWSGWKQKGHHGVTHVRHAWCTQTHLRFEGLKLFVRYFPFSHRLNWDTFLLFIMQHEGGNTVHKPIQAEIRTTGQLEYTGIFRIKVTLKTLKHT